MSRYSVHPMEQDFRNWDAEQKAKRNQYWSALREAREEYILDNTGEYDLTVRPTLHFWMREKYGIVMEMDGTGNYTASYTVEDPKRFMLFQLKFMR